MSLDEVADTLWDQSRSRSKKSRLEFNKMVKRLTYEATERGIAKGLEVKAEMALEYLNGELPEQAD